MKHLSFLIVGGILSAPAMAIPAPVPPQVKSIQWIPENYVQVGDSINALFRISMAAGETSEMWLNVDCRTQKKSLLMMDVHLNTGTVLRAYSTNSISRYAPAVPFEPDASSPLGQDPKLDVCQQHLTAPRWAEISAANEQGDRQFVDVNNSVKEGKMLKVRLATDYAKTYIKEQYGAPYSVKIKDVVMNCENGQGMTKASYSLDNQGLLTDANVVADPVFSTLPPELGDVIKPLCEVKDLTQYQGKGPWVAREKPLADNQPSLPDYEHNDPTQLQRFSLPDAVMAVVKKAVGSADQHPAFSRLTYTQQWVGEGGNSSDIVIDRQPDGTTLSLDKILIGNAPLYMQHQRLFNMVDLRGWDSFSPAPDISRSLDNSFEVPVKAATQYQWHGVLTNGRKAGEEQAKSEVCRTDDHWHDAAQLNKAFSGRYIELTCTDDRGDKRPMSSDYVYLENLRIFLRIGFHENGEKKRFTLTDVVVTP